jgi:hypothetical protein
MRTFPGFEKKISKIWHTIHNFMAWPLTKYGVRHAFLTALAHVAEGAKVVPVHAHGAAYAALADPPRRLCTFHGRDGMAHALGSVYACFVTLFLGGCFRGQEQRRIHTYMFACGGMAVTQDGSTLLLTDTYYDCIRLFAVADGTHLKDVGRRGTEASQFLNPHRIFVARDGFIFVADTGNNRVQVLTPRLHFCAVFGVSVLSRPTCICASDDIVVANSDGRNVCMFARGDGAWLRQFEGSSRCVVSSLALTLGRVIVQATSERVAIFSMEGTLLGCATADVETMRPVIFSTSGEFAAGKWENKLCLGNVAGLCRNFELPSRPSFVAVYRDTVFVRLEYGYCVVVLK